MKAQKKSRLTRLQGAQRSRRKKPKDWKAFSFPPPLPLLLPPPPFPSFSSLPLFFPSVLLLHLPTVRLLSPRDCPAGALNSIGEFWKQIEELTGGGSRARMRLTAAAGLRPKSEGQASTTSTNSDQQPKSN
eukprot:766878-Hanusia_phi.AAC.2